MLPPAPLPPWAPWAAAGAVGAAYLLVCVLLLLRAPAGGQPRSVAAFAAGRERPRVLLVIAHPDDEAMFFAPTLLTLTAAAAAAGGDGEGGTLSAGGTPGPAAPAAVHVLCLSSGDADGLGRVRSKELLSACEQLGVPRAHVEVLDSPQLRDGFKSIWPPGAVAAAVAGAVAQHRIDLLLTFDGGGISGHPNHVSTHVGVRHFLREQETLLATCGAGDGGAGRTAARGGSGAVGAAPRSRPVVGWQLTSTNLLRKFLGVLDVPPSLRAARLAAEADVGPGRSSGVAAPAASARLAVSAATVAPSVVCFVTPSYGRAVAAMRRHASQFVWYRRLFVAAARYTYVNTLAPLPPAAL